MPINDELTGPRQVDLKWDDSQLIGGKSSITRVLGATTDPPMRVPKTPAEAPTMCIHGSLTNWPDASRIRYKTAPETPQRR